ncbi:hypothetical protein Q8F55_004859 [Vanrija albida]|uniref:F-box domain-containing protein n=1 Tax=Vanrija albida TaxID=181172 RepID=A0ABR3Q0I2_9TREE
MAPLTRSRRAAADAALDYKAFPHLVELILELCDDMETLFTLRLVSRRIKECADVWTVQKAISSPRWIGEPPEPHVRWDSGHRTVMVPPYTAVDIVEVMRPHVPNDYYGALMIDRSGTQRHVVVVVLAVPTSPSFELAKRTLFHMSILQTMQLRDRSKRPPKLDIVFAPYRLPDMAGAATHEKDPARWAQTKKPSYLFTPLFEPVGPTRNPENSPGTRTVDGIYSPLFFHLGAFEVLGYGGSVRVLGLDLLPPQYVDLHCDPDISGEAAQDAARATMEEQFHVLVERKYERSAIDNVLKTWGTAEEAAALRRLTVESGTWTVTPLRSAAARAATLDYNAFPHLVELILGLCDDMATLITLRFVSRRIKERADKWMVQHILSSPRPAHKPKTDARRVAGRLIKVDLTHCRVFLPPYTHIDVVTLNGGYGKPEGFDDVRGLIEADLSSVQRHVVVFEVELPPYTSFALARQTVCDWWSRIHIPIEHPRPRQLDLVFVPIRVEDMPGAADNARDPARWPSADEPHDPTRHLFHPVYSVTYTAEGEHHDQILGKSRAVDSIYAHLFCKLGLFEVVAYGGSVRIVGLDSLPPQYVDLQFDPDMSGEAARDAARQFIEEEFRVWVERRAGRTNIQDKGSPVDALLKKWGPAEEDAAVRRLTVGSGVCSLG